MTTVVTCISAVNYSYLFQLFIEAMLQKLLPYVPLFLVFISGVGFSLCCLIIKILAEEGFHGTYQIMIIRGIVQSSLSGYVIYYNKVNGEPAKLFGDSSYASSILLCRSLLGFLGMATGFLAVEHMPIGDASVLQMQSPIVAAILSYFIIGEPWKLAEFTATLFSIVSICVRWRQPFII